MQTVNGIPRRNRLDLNERSEMAIYVAMVEIEQLGADERLTKAITLLNEAKNLVGDFVDDNKK
jgi:hypothetical protein